MILVGNSSSSDEKGAAALLTTELDNSMGGTPTQVRVVQGKEPSHFKHIFNSNKSCLCIHLCC